MKIPEFTNEGKLPTGIHICSGTEFLARFCNGEIRNEFIENIKKDLISNGRDISELNFEETIDYVQHEYRKNHYPKFTLKNCR